jgi:hypothetical protein
VASDLVLTAYQARKPYGVPARGLAAPRRAQMSTTTITRVERFVRAGSCGNRFAAMPQSRHARFAGARLAALRPAVSGEYERRRERRHFFLFQGIIINDIAPTTSSSPTPSSRAVAVLDWDAPTPQNGLPRVGEGQGHYKPAQC